MPLLAPLPGPAPRHERVPPVRVSSRYNSTRPNASYDRGLVATYLGPATDYGPGAVYALLNKQTVRVVASFKFLALPGHHLDPKTLRPPGVERPMPIDRHPAISEHEPERPARSARTRTPRRLFNPGQGGADAAWRDNAAPVNVTIASAPDPAAILVEPPHRVFAGTELDQPALYDNDDARAAAAAHYPDGEAAPVVEPEAPTTLKAALAGDDAEAWCAAYVKQLDAFEEHDTCHPILCEDVPPNATIARSCMTFTVKRDGTKKARLCFDGSKVEKERRSKPDYGSVSSTTPRASSPTASYTSLTFLCAAAAHYGSTITQDDIDSAYLIGRRPTTAYMRFPYGHADWMRREFGADRSAWPYDPEKHVLAVDGNIWGHPDAGAIWFDVIMPFLLNELGFTPTPLDPCLLVRWDAGVPTLLLLFVDDYFIAAAADIAWAINAKISARFKTKGAHLADDALGVDIDMLPNGDVAIHSTSYLTRMLRRYGFSDCHPARPRRSRRASRRTRRTARATLVARRRAPSTGRRSSEPWFSPRSSGPTCRSRSPRSRRPSVAGARNTTRPCLECSDTSRARSGGRSSSATARRPRSRRGSTRRSPTTSTRPRRRDGPNRARAASSSSWARSSGSSRDARPRRPSLRARPSSRRSASRRAASSSSARPSNTSSASSYPRLTSTRTTSRPSRSSQSASSRAACGTSA